PSTVLVSTGGESCRPSTGHSVARHTGRVTERKRPDVTFVNWVEQQIRAAQERGEFDNLPGAGKPIPDHGDDELWWIRSYLAREGLSGEALLPRELQLRREVERLPETI